MLFTDWIDIIFETWGTDYATNMYAIGIFCCVLALFLRLTRGSKC